MPYIIGHNCMCGGGSGEEGSLGMITRAELDQQGHLLFTYEDGTIADAGQVFTSDQLAHLNTGVSETDLGEGLSYADGKLNVTMSVKIGNDLYPIEDGVITLPMADSDTAGLVKLSDEFQVNDDGQVEIGEVDINKLVVNDDTELIIGG